MFEFRVAWAMGFCCFHFHHTSNVCIRFLNYGLLFLHHSCEVCRYVAHTVLRIDENRSFSRVSHSFTERKIQHFANMTVDFQFQTFRGTRNKHVFFCQSFRLTNFMVLIPFFGTNRGITWNIIELPEPPIKLRLVFLAPQPFVPRIRRRISSPMGLG